MKDSMWMHRTGYLTQEERKYPIGHGCTHATIEAVADLSGGVTIKPYCGNYTKEQMACDVAQFTAWWCREIHKRLNGFSGLDCIKWIIEE
jgi:hypothetical protein